MIFVAPSADFSANKIGTVEIPVQMIETTTRVLSYFSQSPNMQIKEALNWFIYSCEQDGLWAKLKFISMPFLANNVNEAIINVQTGKGWVRSDMNDTANAISSAFQVVDKALKVVAGQKKHFLYTGDMQTDDMSVGCYVHDRGTPSGKNDVVIGSSTSSYFLVLSEKQGVNMASFLSPAAAHNDFYISLENNHFAGVSNHNQQSRACIADQTHDVSFTNTSKKVKWFEFGNKEQETYTDGSTWAYMRQSLAMFFVGDGMTTEEFSKFKTYVDNLMKVVYQS